MSRFAKILRLERQREPLERDVPFYPRLLGVREIFQSVPVVFKERREEIRVQRCRIYRGNLEVSSLTNETQCASRLEYLRAFNTL